MAFPASPVVNQEFPLINPIWKWDGEVWAKIFKSESEAPPVDVANFIMENNGGVLEPGMTLQESLNYLASIEEGFQTNHTSVSNLNDAILPGFYTFAAVATGGPGAIGGGSLLVEVAHNFLTQLVVGGNGTFYVRRSFNASGSSWLPWVDYVTQSELTTQLSNKADGWNATLVGVPTAPTATPGTNTTQISTTAFVTALGATKADLTSNNAFTGTNSFASATTFNWSTNFNYGATFIGTVDFAGVSSLVGLTKSHVGLPNVDNVADADKPISVAAAAAFLDLDTRKLDKNNGTISGGGNLNTGTTTGFYRVSTGTITNSPISDMVTGTLFVNTVEGITHQLLTSQGVIYNRTFDVVWTTWVRYATGTEITALTASLATKVEKGSTNYGTNFNGSTTPGFYYVTESAVNNTPVRYVPRNGGVIQIIASNSMLPNYEGVQIFIAGPLSNLGGEQIYTRSFQRLENEGIPYTQWGKWKAVYSGGQEIDLDTPGGLNITTEDGFYVFHSSALGSPPAVGFGHLTVVTTDTMAFQTAHMSTGTYTRQTLTNTIYNWTDWLKVATEEDVLGMFYALSMATVAAPTTSTINSIPVFITNALSGQSKGFRETKVLIDENDAISGYGAVINRQTGTTYTVQQSDSGKIIQCDNANPITVTFPLILKDGFLCTVVQKGAGRVTIAKTDPVPQYIIKLYNRLSHTKTAGQHAMVTVYLSKVFSSPNTLYDLTLGGDTAA